MLRDIRNLDYTIIFCQDLERMRHFYHEVLGFPLNTERPNWIELRVGSSLLALRPREGPNSGPPPPPNSPSLQLAFRVTPSQVESCYVELQEKEVLIIEPPTDKAFGHRTLFFKDPESNILEIYAEL